jgi:hypothetical protein
VAYLKPALEMGVVRCPTSQLAATIRQLSPADGWRGQCRREATITNWPFLARPCRRAGTKEIRQAECPAKWVVHA